MFKSDLSKQTDTESFEKERFRLYMDEMLRNFIGSILVGLPLYYFVFQTPSNVAFIWFSVDALLAATVFFTYYGFYKHNNLFCFTTWKALSYIPLLIFSLSLAIAPWLFLQSQTGIYLYCMMIMIVSISGTISHASSYYVERHTFFLTLPLLSLAVKFSIMESNHELIIYSLIALLWMASVIFAQRITRSLLNSIKLKQENIQARADSERLNIEKSKFIAAASHDIRQPLQAVNLLVSTLKSRSTNSKDEVLFEHLENSVDSMSELLNSLLDVSKLDAHIIVPIPKHICLNTLLLKLKSQFEPFTTLKGINLIINTNDFVVLADAVLLEQVFNNLLSNAVRYTHSGSITVEINDKSEQVLINVKDTGVGISKADQKEIFLEFHQLHNPERDQKNGLGLGLSIVKRLCELQRWPLSLSSEVNVGSCFSFSVPQGKKELVLVADEVHTNKNLTGLDVIIIDDHNGIRFSVSQKLSDWGCKVRSFESADMACDEINKSPHWKPNLIISDYRLRNHLTGIDAIKQIKSVLNYSVESILISGDTSPEILKEIEVAGFILLHKPIKPAKLRVVLSRIMASIFEFKE